MASCLLSLSLSLSLSSSSHSFFSSLQIKLGWKDYLFPLLAQLSDYLQQQSTCSLVHSPTKLELPGGMRQVSVSNMSSHSVGYGSQSRGTTQAGIPMTKLPSFIPVPSHIADVALVHIPSPVLRVMGRSPLLWTDLPLLATVDKLVDNIPTAWKKVCMIHSYSSNYEVKYKISSYIRLMEM